MEQMLPISISVLAVLILLCLLSSKLSSFINMPSLLMFLAVGMLAGSEGIGNIEFDNAEAANAIGTVAMAFILFSGGFDTSWQKVKTVLGTGLLLSSLGVLLTALFTGGLTYGLLRWLHPEGRISVSWCLLLGSVVSSTDAAAVFSILRSRSVSLRGRLRPLLEFESGSNDPMAAFLTIFMVSIVTKELNTGQAATAIEYLAIIPNFAVKMVIGVAVGCLTGLTMAWLFNRIDFEFNGLYYVLGVVAVLFAYGLTELAFGNGFMAVYAAGMVMGNRKFVYHNGVGRFYDGVAWLMQVLLFTMLGLLAFPKQVWEAKWIGLAAAAVLILIARPLAVFIGMARSKFSFAERTLVSWVGLRGGAPIMLATFPLMAGVPEADLMFHIVFFIVITSVVFQGMSIMPMARLLKLDAPLHRLPRIPLSWEETGDKSSTSTEVELGDRFDGRTVAQLGLPEGVLILLIRREEKFLVPRGDTVLHTGDNLTLLGSPEAVENCAQNMA